MNNENFSQINLVIKPLVLWNHLAITPYHQRFGQFQIYKFVISLDCAKLFYVGPLSGCWVNTKVINKYKLEIYHMNVKDVDIHNSFKLVDKSTTNSKVHKQILAQLLIIHRTVCLYISRSH